MDVPGRLAYGCTDLTASWPHGGTGMGFVDKTWVEIDSPVYPLVAMEYGGEGVDEIALGGRALIRCVLRDDDTDALGVAPLNSAAGVPSGYQVISGLGANVAGTFHSSRAVVVVFTPQSVIDGDDGAHDLVVFFHASPRFDEAQRIAHHAQEERQYALAFRALRDSSGRNWKIGRRADLSLA